MMVMLHLSSVSRESQARLLILLVPEDVSVLASSNSSRVLSNLSLFFIFVILNLSIYFLLIRVDPM